MLRSEPKPKCACGQCTCDALKRLDEIYTSSDVMQLDMGLNESFDAIVSNILMMDPLPSFNKVYSLISLVEKRRNMNLSSTTSIEAIALSLVNKKLMLKKKTWPRRKIIKKREDRFCSHYGK